MTNSADTSFLDPSANGHVVGPEAVVLMHHEADTVAHIVYQRLGFCDRFCKWLLTHYVHAVIGGHAGYMSMCADRGRDVDRIEPALSKHLSRFSVYP